MHCVRLCIFTPSTHLCPSRFHIVQTLFPNTLLRKFSKELPIKQCGLFDHNLPWDSLGHLFHLLNPVFPLLIISALQQFSWVPKFTLFPSLALFSFLSITIFKLIKPGLISPPSSLCLTDDKYVLDSSDSSCILADKDNLLSKYRMPHTHSRPSRSKAYLSTCLQCSWLSQFVFLTPRGSSPKAKA